MSNARDAMPGDVDLDSLDPLIFFAHDQFLRQKDIVDYEHKLKEVLTKLMSSPDSTEATSPLQQIVQSLQDVDLAHRDLNVAPSPKDFLAGLIPLLSDLHRTNNLVRLSVVQPMLTLSDICLACIAVLLRPQSL
jgi:hypothetical protein